MRVHLHRCRKLSSHLRADAMVSLGQSHIFKRFSTRFPLIAARAAVVSDEVLASQAGLDVLRRGGNAADAALAMSACMGVLQTYTTGVGGDCFALYYDAQTKKTHCVDGSGRSPAVLTLEQVEARSHVEGAFLKQSAGLYATVPGVAKAWFYIVSRFGSGKLNLCELLEPAVYCAEHGFPMDHVKQGMLISCLDRLKQIPGGHYFLDAGSQIPRIGQIITNRPLGALLKSLAQGGPQVIYEGPVARSIVDAVCQACGVLTNGDLAEHLVSTEPLEVEPVSTTCRGDVTVYTTPLPTQGVVLLETLNILEGFDLRVLRHVPGDFEHLVIEALRHAIADGLRHVADGASGGSVQEMLSKEHAGKLREQVNLHRRAECVYPEGAVHHGLSDTTFSAAADGSGNVCALMGSISNFFGCAVVQEYRFSVQARGTGFNLEANHPKCFGPRKKPYHSVMPVMVTDAQTHDWLCTMGTLGGLPQPIILAQVLLNMMELGLDPQQALAKPRMILGSPFHPHPDGSLTVEADFPEELLRSLPRRGHTTQDKYASDVEHDVGNTNVRAKAARWCVHEETAGSRVSGDNAIWCGSEPRTAAAALGY